jgi:hypothetical protein
MRSRATEVLVLLLGSALLIGGLHGCYDSKPCGREVCDGRDNDCDDLTDEGFVDAAGDYTELEHCGACNVSCDAVVPSAASTECRAGDDGEYRCVASNCPEGEVLRDGACGAPTIALCAPCDSDEECEALAEGAQCLPEGHCGQPCVIGTNGCPRGFDCLARAAQPDGEQASDTAARVVSADGQCTPATGSCSCTPAQIGLALGCALVSPEGARCVGERECTAGGLTECRPAIEETCNGLDDDCNGAIDESFVDELGRYVSAEHCGACNAACIAPGAHMVAACIAPAADIFPDVPARCDVECEPGFVDVDGLSATGCECSLLSPGGPVIGGDADCDGVIDETPDLIFVAPQGDDTSDGQDVGRPVRTLARGSALGQLTGRRVLVARGVYQGPLALVGGVTLLGGYSADFRERDPSQHPSLIEHGSAALGPSGGAPVVTCTDIDLPTRLEGFTVLGTDATTAGAGSTTVYLSGCSDDVALADITVLAGRGAAGTAGDNSSSRLASWGLGSLTELSGNDGGSGGAGTPSDSGICLGVAAGSGGQKVCSRGAASQRDVAGGNGGASECTDLSTLCVNGSGMPCGNAGCTDFTSGGVCDLDAALELAVSQPAAQPGRGADGGDEGVQPYSAPTNRNVCNFCDDNPSLPREGGDGGDGVSGDHGPSGEGCGMNDLFDSATGRMSSGAGEDGEDGDDGSGGGGATAGGGFAAIGNTPPRDGSPCSNRAGGSGGGGGSGGCGAPGAGGGTGGGSSIGIAIHLGQSSVGPSFTRVRVVTGSGGDGGPGGIGAAGGTGGTGALGGTAAFFCARNGGRGGDGGPGGAGGGAGGGCGGSSYGLVLVGDPTAGYLSNIERQAVIERAGVAGRAGAGGFSPGNRGENGLAGSVQDRLVLSP